MTRTIVESKSRTAIIGFDQPFCVIGERINPTGRKVLAAQLEAGDFSTVEKDALEQVASGATMLDVNAGVVYNSNPNPNETEPPLMRQMIELVQGLVDVPLCIDSSVPAALEAGLAGFIDARFFQGECRVDNLIALLTAINRFLVSRFLHGPCLRSLTAERPAITYDAIVDLDNPELAADFFPIRPLPRGPGNSSPGRLRRCDHRSLFVAPVIAAHLPFDDPADIVCQLRVRMTTFVLTEGILKNAGLGQAFLDGQLTDLRTVDRPQLPGPFDGRDGIGLRLECCLNNLGRVFFIVLRLRPILEVLREHRLFGFGQIKLRQDSRLTL